MATRSRKKAIAEPATPRARDPRDVEMIERLQQRIQELEFQQLHFKEEPIMFVEDESCPVYDTDNEEEESMPVYDTDIKDVIEEEEGFIGKGGSNEEEKDGDKDEVVYADDINQNDIGSSGKKYQEGYLKAAPIDDKLGFTTIKMLQAFTLVHNIFEMGIITVCLRGTTTIALFSGDMSGLSPVRIQSPAIIPSEDVGPTRFSVKQLVPRWQRFPSDMSLRKAF
ncbi:hypothetical protein Tco_0116663 [Tanacetum coccineum]